MLKKMFNIFTLVIALGLIAVSVLIFQAALGGFKNSGLPKEKLVLGGETFSIEIARTIAQKIAGLSGRSGLGRKEGMLLIFDSPSIRSFWMKDMNFPIDIIWIRGEKIVGFSENAVPEPGKKIWELKMYSPPEPVDRVLEVNAGVVQWLNLRVGDKTRINQ